MLKAPMLISVLLVDDHQAILDALSALLQSDERLRVVDAVTSVKRAITAMRKHQPQLVVMDVRLDGASGLDSITEIRTVLPDVKLVMLSMYTDESYVWRALQLGADAYVTKQAPAHELTESIHSVMRGERFIGSGISLERLAEYERNAKSLSTDPLDRLTPRERQVAKLAAQSLTSEQIADRLGIGRRTVESHRAHIAHKLGVNTTIELVRLMMRRAAWK